MSKFTITIKDNENEEIKTRNCDAIFAGYADEENCGSISLVNASGFSISLAIIKVEEVIEKFFAHNPTAKLACELLKSQDGLLEEKNNDKQGGK